MTVDLHPALTQPVMAVILAVTTGDQESLN